LKLIKLKRRPGPCARIVLAAFGFFFLIALLFVPVTIRTSSLRTDANSQVVIRTTHPRAAHVFLLQYLSLRAHPREGMTVRARSFQWVAFMIVVAVLGLFDYGFFCRLLRRRRRPEEEAGPDEEDPGDSGSSPSSLSLFR